jgi:hypothetical protein
MRTEGRCLICLDRGRRRRIPPSMTAVSVPALPAWAGAVFFSFIFSTLCEVVSVQCGLSNVRCFAYGILGDMCENRRPHQHLPHQLSLKAPAA